MPSVPVKGAQRPQSANNQENALDFIIERALSGKLNTALPVRVDSVEAGGPGPVGFCTITPLVAGLDGSGNAIPKAPVHNVPYSRIQGGKAALIIDPEPGDLGWAVFCQRDISSVKRNKGWANPGSSRVFDQADAIYLGGILNKEPEIYLELTQDNVANLVAPMKVFIDSPETELSGNLMVQGNVTWAGIGRGANGAARFEGGISNSGGQVESNGKVLDSHTHSGVQTGSGNTGGPN